MKRVIFDTGPLVAWFCPRDQHHAWALLAFAGIHSGGIVCEAVLTEVCHLTAKERIARSRVMDFVIAGDIHIVSLGAELQTIRDYLNRYADTPMDFADACVTRLAELYEESTVCTTDTDFLVYRKNRSQVIPVLAPFTAVPSA
jgi:predicted nucleic acid-binding protein